MALSAYGWADGLWQGTLLTLLEEGREGDAQSGESLRDGAGNSVCNRLGDVDFNAVTSEILTLFTCCFFLPHC